MQEQLYHIKSQFTFHAVSDICQYLVLWVDLFIRILHMCRERGQYLLSELTNCS